MAFLSQFHPLSDHSALVPASFVYGRVISSLGLSGVGLSDVGRSRISQAFLDCSSRLMARHLLTLAT